MEKGVDTLILNKLIILGSIIFNWLLEITFLLLLFLQKYSKFDGIGNGYIIILPLLSFLIGTLRFLHDWKGAEESEKKEKGEKCLVLCYNGLAKLELFLFIYYVGSFYVRKTYYALIPSYIMVLLMTFYAYLRFNEILNDSLEWISTLMFFFQYICFDLSIILRISSIYHFSSFFIFSMKLWGLPDLLYNCVSFLRSLIESTPQDKWKDDLIYLSVLTLHSSLQVMLLLRLENIIGNPFWCIVLIIGIFYTFLTCQVLSCISELLKICK
jgi:hypothetical protein